MGLNVIQSSQDQFRTQLRVDELNSSILRGKKTNDEIQKEQFLNLLVAQLKHQNPLDPMNDREFIAQMAQLTSLEKLEALRSGLEEMGKVTQEGNLYNLLGRSVSFINDSGLEEKGIVSGIEFKDKQAFLSLNGKLVQNKSLLKVEI